MRFKRVCLGGTFSPIHAGHRSLLKEAFSSGDLVSIGLTSDAMASRGRIRKVATYSNRMADLKEECSPLSAAFGNGFEIREISDPVGFALEGDIEAIVVSEETLPGALTINELRTGKGLDPLRVLTVPIMRDVSGEKISSTALQRAEAGRPKKVDR